MSQIEHFTPDQIYNPNLRANQQVSPTAIMKGTSSVIEGYFKGFNHSQLYTQVYLSEDTLPFLQKVKSGTRYAQMLREMGLRRFHTDTISNNGVIERIAEYFGEAPEDTKDKLQAYHSAVTVYGAMRYNFRLPTYPIEFSSRGMLRPPRSSEEFLRRTETMYKVIDKISEGDFDPTDSPTRNTQLLGTYAFFKVGADLPLQQEAA